MERRFIGVPNAIQLQSASAITYRLADVCWHVFGGIVALATYARQLDSGQHSLPWDGNGFCRIHKLDARMVFFRRGLYIPVSSCNTYAGRRPEPTAYNVYTLNQHKPDLIDSSLLFFHRHRIVYVPIQRPIFQLFDACWEFWQYTVFQPIPDMDTAVFGIFP